MSPARAGPARARASRAARAIRPALIRRMVPFSSVSDRPRGPRLAGGGRHGKPPGKMCQYGRVGVATDPEKQKTVCLKGAAFSFSNQAPSTELINMVNNGHTSHSGREAIRRIEWP